MSIESFQDELAALASKWERLMMDSRVVNQIEEFYRQDAKFTERKKRVSKRNSWKTLFRSL
jgi:hypothetical protein